MKKKFFICLLTEIIRISCIKDNSAQEEVIKLIKNAKIENLTSFNLDYKSIEVLPNEIGELKNLIKLCITGNKFNSLPKEIGELKNLEILHLHTNKLTSLT